MKKNLFVILLLILSTFVYSKANNYLYDNYAYSNLDHKIIIKGKVWDEVIALEANTKQEFIIPVSILLDREPFFLYKNKYQTNPNYKRCFLNGKAGANIDLKKVFIVLNELVCVNSDGVPTLKKRIKGYVLDKETNLGIKGKPMKFELVKGKKVKGIKINGAKKVISVFQIK